MPIYLLHLAAWAYTFSGQAPPGTSVYKIKQLFTQRIKINMLPAEYNLWCWIQKRMVCDLLRHRSVKATCCHVSGSLIAPVSEPPVEHQWEPTRAEPCTSVITFPWKGRSDSWKTLLSRKSSHFFWLWKNLPTASCYSNFAAEGGGLANVAHVESDPCPFVKRANFVVLVWPFSAALRTSLSENINQADLAWRQPSASCPHDKMRLTSFASDHPFVTDLELFG